MLHHHRKERLAGALRPLQQQRPTDTLAGVLVHIRQEVEQYFTLTRVANCKVYVRQHQVDSSLTLCRHIPCGARRNAARVVGVEHLLTLDIKDLAATRPEDLVHHGRQVKVDQAVG